MFQPTKLVVIDQSACFVSAATYGDGPIYWRLFVIKIAHILYYLINVHFHSTLVHMKNGDPRRRHAVYGADQLRWWTPS